MEVEFLDRLSEPVRDKKAKSVSDIIRTALEQFDFEDAVVMRPAQVQISVRLSAEIRKNLKRVSRSKHTSVGHLVRAAVEGYLPELEALPHPEDPKPAPKPAKSSQKKKKSSQRAPAKSAKPKARRPARR
jgi:predicted DNA-binding protein